MTKVQPLASNVAWLLVDRAGRLGLGLVVSIYLARSLGPALFGALSYAQATIGLIGFFALLSTEAIIIRMLVDEPKRSAEILGSALAIRAAGGLALVAAASLIAVIVDVPAGVGPALVLISAGTFFLSADVVDHWFRVRLQSRFPVVARLCALSVGAALRIAAAASPDPVQAVALAILVESTIIGAALLLTFHWRNSASDGFVVARSRVRRILAESAPMLLSAVAVAIYVRFGFIVLERTAGTAEVGQLGAATLVAETLHALPVAIAGSYGPILLARRQQNQAMFEHDLLRLLRMFHAAGLVTSLVVCLSAPAFMPFLLGPDYAASGQILAVLVWSILFVYLSVGSELWFIGSGTQRYLLAKTLLSAAVFVALALILIPRYKGLGAAWTTVLSYSVSAFWSNLVFPGTRPLFYRQLRALLFMPAKPELAGRPLS